MDTLQVILLSLIQGITEFLPISSSAHLILPSQLLGWTDQGLAFDVAVHFGSLIAVMAYFRADIQRMLIAWTGHVIHRRASEDAELAWYVILATIPAVVFGLILNIFGENLFRHLWIIAATTIGFGILLGVADLMYEKRPAKDNRLTLKRAMIIGFAQPLALIPGTSRSGITMTAALMLGLSRDLSARFSFLLSIPLILAASLLKTKDLIESSAAVDWQTLGLGVVVSALSAFACIHFFLNAINRMGFMPFVIYRLVLGVFLLFVIF
ncbi:Undecaprenyl-diphosphatase [BD1-7 clade bacterium]|uniref:Undecaprenyl-diphosphatase n=1 Tax=BD1-7 clade bacterium TaxID=2029982 RepID=A0A5S9N3F5_9GAMM|nr:Undecaprenyl-diphosphatase [BD1-7 clade bacterium]